MMKIIEESIYRVLYRIAFLDKLYINKIRFNASNMILQRYWTQDLSIKFVKKIYLFFPEYKSIFLRIFMRYIINILVYNYIYLPMA